MPDHTAAFEQVKQALISGEGKVIGSLSEVSAIGHRVGAGRLEVRSKRPDRRQSAEGY